MEKDLKAFLEEQYGHEKPKTLIDIIESEFLGEHGFLESYYLDTDFYFNDGTDASEWAEEQLPYEREKYKFMFDLLREAIDK